MKRREFITLLGGAAAWPLTARAQQPGRTRRIGVLIAFSNDLEFQGLIKAFKQTLEAQGWMDGQNVQFDERWAQGDAKRIPALAAEMMSATPDVILAVATPVLVALRQQTRTIPLVFVNVSDPVDGGFVETMARPGGNITGFTSFEYSIGGKWLELLKEASPSLKRVMVLLNQDNYTSRALLHTINALAPANGVQLSTARVRNYSEIEVAMRAFGQQPNGAIIILPDPVMTVIAGALRNWQFRTASRQFTPSGSSPRTGASCLMERTISTSTGGQRPTSMKFSKARTWPRCQCRIPPGTHSSSTSKRPKH